MRILLHMGSRLLQAQSFQVPNECFKLYLRAALEMLRAIHKLGVNLEELSVRLGIISPKHLLSAVFSC